METWLGVFHMCAWTKATLSATQRVPEMLNWFHVVVASWKVRVQAIGLGGELEMTANVECGCRQLVSRTNLGKAS
jgi:hypothetical protein